MIGEFRHAEAAAIVQLPWSQHGHPAVKTFADMKALRDALTAEGETFPCYPYLLQELFTQGQARGRLDATMPKWCEAYCKKGKRTRGLVTADCLESHGLAEIQPILE
eukprot:11193086-Lingulodinium_polyedra.AAC.1